MSTGEKQTGAPNGRRGDVEVTVLGGARPAVRASAAGAQPHDVAGRPRPLPFTSDDVRAALDELSESEDASQRESGARMSEPAPSARVTDQFSDAAWRRAAERAADGTFAAGVGQQGAPASGAEQPDRQAQPDPLHLPEQDDAPAEQGADPGESDDVEAPDGGGEGEGDGPRKRFASRLGRVALGALAAVVLVCVVAASLFAWNRWGRYDDHADMQGDWFVAGTAVPVAIDADCIHLSDDVAYRYQLDQREKTLTYEFGNWEGRGRYRFSGDRRTLVIIDGEFDGMATTADDFTQTFQDLLTQLRGVEPSFPERDGAIALSRDVAVSDRVIREVAIRAAAERESAQEAQGSGEDEDGLGESEETE